jgi:hypothetical protein
MRPTMTLPRAIGPPDFGMNISGLLILDYSLTHDSRLTFETAGASKIMSVKTTSQKREDIVVYDVPREIEWPKVAGAIQPSRCPFRNE